MEFKLGILGATGYIGEPYRSEIRSASQSASIVALGGRRQARLKEAQAVDGAQYVTSDWRRIVEDPDVNLVLVLTPDAHHHEAVIAAAAAGKHIFCEKPIGIDVQQASEMCAAVKQNQVASYVPFWTRYIPAFVRAREFVQQGKLGEPRAIIYRWHNPRPLGMPFTWRDDANVSSAGTIADVGSHAYDALRFILGSDAQRVLTHARTLMPAKPDLGEIDLTEALEWGRSHSVDDWGSKKRGTVPDYAQMALEFDSDLVGSIVLSHASYLRKGFAPELEIHGTEASLSVNRITGELLLADSTDPARRWECHEDHLINRFETHVFPAFEAQLAGSPLDNTPDLEAGLHVQRFIDAAVSSATKGLWVELGR